MKRIKACVLFYEEKVSMLKSLSEKKNKNLPRRNQIFLIKKFYTLFERTYFVAV